MTIPPPSLPSLPGEAVACDGDGMPCFDRLRYRRQDGRVFVYAFDLIELDGDDLRHEPIERRKAALAKLIRRTKTSLVLNEHIDEPGDVVFRHARESSGSKASYRRALARPTAPAVCGTGLQGVVE